MIRENSSAQNQGSILRGRCTADLWSDALSIGPERRLRVLRGGWSWRAQNHVSEKGSRSPSFVKNKLSSLVTPKFLRGFGQLELVGQCHLLLLFWMWNDCPLPANLARTDVTKSVVAIRP